MKFSDTSDFHSSRGGDPDFWEIVTYFGDTTPSETWGVYPDIDDYIYDTSETVDSGIFITDLWTLDTTWMNYVYVKDKASYTITFEPNGGKPTRRTETLKRVTTEASPSVIEGDLPDVERTNFFFEGWYLDNESFLDKVKPDVTPFNSNTTVYAKWDWQPKKDYKDFYFRNKLLSEFNGFIINEGDDLKFFNPSNFSHEFTTPQFSNRSFLTGTSRENREFNFNIFLQEVDLEEYKEFLDWLNPEYKGVLILSYNTDYGYDVKVNSLSEATFYVCRECTTNETDDGDDKYNIELEIGFITEKDWAARNLKEEHSLSNTIILKRNIFGWYHEITNSQNLENYLIIKFENSLEIEARGEGQGEDSIVNIVNESSELSATYYSQYGIAILEDGSFLGGTIVPLVIPPKTSIDKYLIKIDNPEIMDGSETINGSIKMTSREII